MGISDKDAELRAARLNPQEPKPAKPTGVSADDQLSAIIGNERLLRGIPVAGIGGGAITGTRPGDTAANLERANRELHAAMMAKARANLEGKP